MTTEVSPESPPAYSSLANDGSGVPLAGNTPAVVPQTEQQQQYNQYCAQQNTTVLPEGAVIIEQHQLPEGAVVIEQQQPQVVTMQPTNGAQNYCYKCDRPVSFITKESYFKPILR